MQLQVTICSKKYKPISTLVEMPIKEILAKNYKPYVERGIQRICAQRHFIQGDLRRYGYTEVKYRPYDPQKIKEENEKRYEKIKEERGWK